MSVTVCSVLSGLFVKVGEEFGVAVTVTVLVMIVPALSCAV